jgi:6-pyruvoyltetrahydropterin/6-carboxytetrahydropterin synthase
MYEVGVVAQFEAAHRLVGDFGPATRMHGHTYRVEVVVRGERLSEDGALFDIGRLRELVDALMATMHLRDLADVPGLAGINTTAEAVADYCWATLVADLTGQGLTALLVRVWESPLAWAARDGGLPG